MRTFSKMGRSIRGWLNFKEQLSVIKQKIFNKTFSIFVLENLKETEARKSLKKRNWRKLLMRNLKKKTQVRTYVLIQ